MDRLLWTQVIEGNPDPEMPYRKRTVLDYLLILEEELVMLRRMVEGRDFIMECFMSRNTPLSGNEYEKVKENIKVKIPKILEETIFLLKDTGL